MININNIIMINKMKINKLFKNINFFYKNNCRNKNDKCNKIREKIVYLIINNEIPNIYYEYSTKWTFINNKIHKFINNNLLNNQKINNNLLNNQTINNKDISYKCILKGGRKFNYDFDLIINNIKYNTEYKYKLELKYNVDNIIDCPQFVSPMYPSSYLSNSYENFYYNNCISLISELYNLSIPTYNDYIKEIHKNKPKNIMREYQIQYYKGSKGSSKFTKKEKDIIIYNKTKEIAKKSISDFILFEETKLDIQKLSDYLINSQKNKVYMLINKGNFTYQKMNINNYNLDKNYCKKTKNSFIVKTNSGIKLNILLRWKNGNGIAFPAFQIKIIK